MVGMGPTLSGSKLNARSDAGGAVSGLRQAVEKTYCTFTVTVAMVRPYWFVP